MNYETFLSAVAADEKKLAAGIAPFGVEICADCSRPLVQQEQPLGDGTMICVGCYWGRLSAHLDSHPIRALRVSGPTRTVVS